MPQKEAPLTERVQTGVRLEKRLLKVLKALAAYHEMSLGELLESIVLHAFDGTSAFDEESRQRIVEMKRIYELDLDAGGRASRPATAETDGGTVRSALEQFSRSLKGKA
ncbi:MAG: hypothetical protein ACE5HV_01880 [Acidobacteriota bacterium]